MWNNDWGNKGDLIHELMWYYRVAPFCLFLSQLSVSDLDDIMWILLLNLNCVWNACIGQVKERGLGRM